MLNREIIVYINSNYDQIAEKDSISNVVIFRARCFQKLSHDLFDLS